MAEKKTSADIGITISDKKTSDPGYAEKVQMLDATVNVLNDFRENQEREVVETALYLIGALSRPHYLTDEEIARYSERR